MYRSLVIVTLAFIGGIISNYYLQVTPGYWLLFLTLLFIVLLISRGRHPAVAAGIILMLALVSGALRYSFAHYPGNDAVVYYLGRGVITLTGVAGEKSVDDYGRTALTVRTRAVGMEQGSQPASGLVRVILSPDLDGSLVLWGDRVEVRGILTRPEGPTNPGEFDYPAYLLRRGIRVSLAVDHPEDIRVVHRPVLSLGRGTSALRDRLIQITYRTLPEEYAGLQAGMLYGYRADISEQVTETLSLAGVVHILAVSGLHVGYILYLAVALGRLAGLGGRLAAGWNLAVIYLYILLTGGRPPVIRAGMMAGFGSIGDLLGRPRDNYTALATAALFLLLGNPLYLFDLSFQLSFAAAGGIIHLAPWLATIRGNWPPWLKRMAAAVLGAQLGVAPLLLYYYYQLTPVAFLANICIIPLAGVAVILGFAAGLLGLVHLGLAAALNTVNQAVLWLIIQAAGGLAGLPLAQLYFPRPAVAVVVIYYLILLALPFLRPVFRPVRDRPGTRLRLRVSLYGTIGLLMVVLWVIPRFTPPGIEVTFLSVGEGDAAFIKTSRNGGVLIDGGIRVVRPEYTVDQGKKVLQPFLRQQGIRRLAVIFTHLHDDHIGGLLTVLEEFDVVAVYGPGLAADTVNAARLGQLIREKDIVFQRLAAGDELLFEGGARLVILSPAPEQPAVADANESSLVARLVYGPTAVLFTGDIGVGTAEQLLARGADLEAAVLKVPHHGSDDLAANPFFAAVGARYAVISVGRNSYGHPSGRVITAIEQAGTRVLRTDQDGAVTVRISRGQVSVLTFQTGGI